MTEDMDAASASLDAQTSMDAQTRMDAAEPEAPEPDASLEDAGDMQADAGPEPIDEDATIQDPDAGDAPRWHAWEYLERPAQFPLYPFIRVAPNGSMVALLNVFDGPQFYALWSAWYDPVTGWAEPLLIEEQDMLSGLVDVFYTADNVAHVVWCERALPDDPQRIWYRTITAGGLSAPLPLFGPDDSVFQWPELVQDAQGALHLFAMHRLSGAVYRLSHRVKEPGGAWSAAQDVATSLVENFSPPSTVLDAAASLHILRVEQSAGSQRLVWLRRQAQSWQPQVPVTAWSTDPVYSHRLRLTPDGRLVATWFQGDRYFAAHCELAGACEPPQALSGRAAEQDWLAPWVAAAANGRTTFLWSERNANGLVEVWSRSHLGGQGWGAALRLSGELECSTGSTIKVVTTPAGHTFAVWSTCRPPDFDRYHAWASRYDPMSDAWSERAQLSSTLLYATAQPALISDDEGVVTVAWAAFEHTAAGRLAANVYTPGEGWSGEALIEQDNAGVANGYVMFIDRQGTTNIVWEKKPHSAAGEIRAASRARSGAWSTPISLSAGHPGYPGGYGEPVVLVPVSPARMMAVWTMSDGAIVSAHHY